MNNPFDYIPDASCEEAYRELLGRLEVLKKSSLPEDVNFCRELESGKMLGVLVAEDGEGVRHPLFAFSGQLGSGGFDYPGFVGPVFDYLQPEGVFKTGEAAISRMNKEIRELEEGELAMRRREYEEMREHLDGELQELKALCRASSLERQRRRESGEVTPEESAAMIARSQFEKGELRRLKKRHQEQLSPVEAALRSAREKIEMMKERRRRDSERLQSWLFTNFKVLNALGEWRSLSDIFAETPLKVPPSGAGECCAPKLLQAAYLRGWLPLAMAEYWYGAPKGGEVRIEGAHYPACRGKCLPVLGWMLRGLDVEPPIDCDLRAEREYQPEIVYENEWFCVVNKPSGMLSVPGKGAALSVEGWLAARYGGEREVKVAHRLDRDTSGLLVATFGSMAYKLMQRLFAARRVEKRYVAVLEGDYKGAGLPAKGRIELPLSADYLDRPRQRVDRERGKWAVTEYEFTGSGEGGSRVVFRPLTGRTHQLRVHAASEQGLGMPIAGDPLYGSRRRNPSDRLMLHAEKLAFTFPLDGHHYSFEAPAPF